MRSSKCAQQKEDVEDIQIPDSQEDVPHDITVGDEAGTITLKKDGTPEYGEAAFSDRTDNGSLSSEC